MARRLIIEVPFKGNDLDDRDFEIFKREARKADGIILKVGRGVTNDGVLRVLELAAETFKCTVEKE